MRLLRLILALLIIATAAAHAGPLEEGVTAHKSGQFGKALSLFRRLAEGGNAPAQYNLGILYANGDGVERNYAEAISWFRKAADQEFADAQFNLGAMYFRGEGVPID